MQVLDTKFEAEALPYETRFLIASHQQQLARQQSA